MAPSRRHHSVRPPAAQVSIACSVSKEFRLLYDAYGRAASTGLCEGATRTALCFALLALTKYP